MSDNFPTIPDFSGIHDKLEDTIRLQAENKNRLAGRYDAGEIFEHLMRRVKEYQDRLQEDEEIGIKLANFGEAAQLHIRSIGYKNPNLIEFHGVNTENHEVTLVQHMSQLNFLLIAMKPLKDQPYRIGFGR